MTETAVRTLYRLARLCVMAGLLAMAGCASLPTGYPRSISHAFNDTTATQLGRAAAHASDAGTGISGVHLLSRGIDAFAARLALTGLAERSLDVQTYIWRSDTTGRILADALLRAADRGVRVRLLVDDVGVPTDDSLLRLLDAHPGIELRLFNPVVPRTARLLGALFDFDRSNRRMHNKSFIADNQAAIVGGRNVGDEYFEARLDLDFDDLDVLAVGPAVREISESFDRYWNSEAAYPLSVFGPGMSSGPDLAALRETIAAYARNQAGGGYAQAVRETHIGEQLAGGTLAFTPARVRVLADDPGKLEQDEPDSTQYLLTRMLPEFMGSRREVIFVSPYLVPGEGGVGNLKRLRARGVRVRIVTNSLAATDVPAVHAGYAKYRQALLEAGIELYEVRPTPHRSGAVPLARRIERAGVRGSSRASLHAKLLVFDCRQFFVGSMNVDPRSIKTNTEIGLVIDAPELGARLCEGIERALPAMTWRVERQPQADGSPRLAWVGQEDGREVRLTQEPGDSGWRRFQVWLFSVLGLDALL